MPLNGCVQIFGMTRIATRSSMDNERKLEIRVGFFLILGVLILVFGVMWGRGVHLFSDAPRLTVRFDDVYGLEVGDPVVIRGIEQGKVSQVALQDQSVLVTLQLNDVPALQSDLRVWIADRDLMGGKQVTLDPGKSGRPHDPQTIIPGTQKGNLMTLLTLAETLVRRLDETVLMIQPVFASGQIESTLTDLQTTARHAGKTIEDIRPYWTAASKRIETASRQLENDSTLVRINRVTGEMETVLTQFQVLIQKVDKGEGTFDRLVRDRQLYDHLLTTTLKMDSLVTDIKANPKRYLHVSLF